MTAAAAANTSILNRTVLSMLKTNSSVDGFVSHQAYASLPRSDSIATILPNIVLKKREFYPGTLCLTSASSMAQSTNKDRKDSDVQQADEVNCLMNEL